MSSLCYVMKLMSSTEILTQICIPLEALKVLQYERKLFCVFQHLVRGEFFDNTLICKVTYFSTVFFISKSLYFQRTLRVFTKNRHTYASYKNYIFSRTLPQNRNTKNLTTNAI